MPPALTRSSMNSAMSGMSLVGNAGIAMWPSETGGTIVDLTPVTYLGQLTGERIGATYGWQRVYVDSDINGFPVVRLWEGEEAQSGTPLSLPAIEVNGTDSLPAGLVVKIWPCEQGGTWKYYFNAFDNFGSGSGNGDSDLNSVTIGPYIKSIDDIYCATDYYGNPVIRIQYTVEQAHITGPNLTVILEPPSE